MVAREAAKKKFLKMAESKGSAKGTDPVAEAAKQSGRKEETAERLERVESALKLVLDHLETMRRGSETIEAQHSRTLLSSIAFGISAISIIALWSIAVLNDDRFTEILRFSLGMSLVFLASALDLASTPILRRAVHRAISEKDPSFLILGKGPWYRFFLPSYWNSLKEEANSFFHYQILRCTAFTLYIVALGLLIWAIQLL